MVEEVTAAPEDPHFRGSGAIPAGQVPSGSDASEERFYSSLINMALQNIRRIVPAVKNPRVKVSSNAFIRRAPKLDYAKARQRWWIHVDFNSDIDLFIFEKALNPSEIRLVELNDAFYIEDPRITDSAHMADADRLAESIIAELNGVTRLLCPHFQGVRKESMIELLDNGTGLGIASCEVAVHGTSDFPAIATFLTGKGAPINSILPRLKSNKNVQEAIYYLGAEGNAWANLYKACEIVEDYAGGEKAIFQSRWCSRAAWERFRRTANHQEAIGRFSRHARSQAAPPPDPMTVAEARLFAGELVKNWIESVTAGEKEDTSAQG